jgi:AraC-like DNA-binding protein
MLYEEYAPPLQVQEIVAAFWRFELEPDAPAEAEHTIPPDGTMTLAVVGTADGPTRVALVGPRVTALRVPVRRDHRYLGVRLRPGTAAGVLGVSPLSLRERVTTLDAVAPDRAAQLAGRLSPWPSAGGFIETMGVVLTAWGRAAAPPDPVVLTMVDRVRASLGRGRVQSLCAGTGVGYRHALRRFQAAVGLSPKEFARLVRIREACVQALRRADASWAAISAEVGFADQAHLAREFSDVYGWRPNLVRAYLQRIEHRNLRP